MAEPTPAFVRSALFVDFDNIFINLRRYDPDAALQFATNPDRWLSWLEEQVPAACSGGQYARRRILFRRCYLNPQSFGSYRPYFISRAAFEVVDCPPLTAQGKTSTDIHIVMDILDALSHPTYIGEFILFSADSDFTPVLLKLRKHDRCSAILSVGYVSRAYIAASDVVISQEQFIRDGLGILDAPDDDELEIVDVTELVGTRGGLLRKMADRLYAVAIVPGGIQASELPSTYREFSEFRYSTDWLGFGTLRRLTEAIVRHHDGLTVIDDDPWRVARLAVVATPGSVEDVTESATVDADTQQELRAAVAEWTREIVSESQTAVPLAALAQAISERFGLAGAGTQWLGAGSFKNLLTELDLGQLQLVTIGPGYLRDPERHEMPVVASQTGDDDFASLPAGQPLDTFLARYPDLAPLARKISQLTDTPYLMPEHYALLLNELAREINERGYQLTRTSKTVRDRCVERGAPVARSHVNFVLFGLGNAGYRFGANLPEDPHELGDLLAHKTIDLARLAQMDLSEEDESLIYRWITGDLATPDEAEAVARSAASARQMAAEALQDQHSHPE